MKQARADSEGGFALIESIAVLALAALVLTTLLIATELVVRNAGAAARRAHNVETLATGFAALRRDLAGAQFLRAPGGEESPLLFIGGPESVGLVIGKDGSELGAGSSVVWIEAEYERGQGKLVRTSGRLLPQTEAITGVSLGNPAALLAGPWAYRFSYAGVSEGAVTWVKNWTNPKAMPKAIRLDVMDAQGERPVAPPLVVKLHIDTETGCGESEDGSCGQEEDPNAEQPEDVADDPGQQD